MKRRALSFLLALVMIISLLPMAAFADVSVGDLGENSYNQILSKTEYAVAPGINETDVVINNKQLTEQNMGYVMEIDMSNPNVHIVAGYKDYQGEKWGMQTVRNQAKAAEPVLQGDSYFGSNAKVVGAINANFFNMSTGEPLGPLVMNGKICHKIAGNHEYGYFAVFEDGHAEIFRDDVAIPAGVVEAMGGANMLLEKGEVCGSAKDGHDQANRNPRSAVGIKADGNVVLYEVDGRQAPMSVGMTCYEMAEILRGMGCVDALLLDGGGSATFCTRREGDEGLTVQNSLSDGNERTVSGTILVVSNAASDGDFARASITPKGQFVTPESQVQFKATGLDASGAKCALPEGLVWALEDESMGSIDENGLFTAGKDVTGEVKVVLKAGNKTVGSATLQIQIPDKLEFANDGLNLKYNEKKDLGLRATYKGNEITYKVGDIIWDVSVETISIGKNGETEDVASGYMDGNLFIANPNNALGNRSVESTVTAVSKWDESIKDTMMVGIGKEPVVVMDGGDNDGHDYSNIGVAHAAPSGGGVEYETHIDDHGDVILVHYVGRTLRGYCGSTAEQVDIDNGMVRFGEKAIKVNYDFTDITGTEGACLGFDHDITISGNPTGIGCWVYAPEGTPNLWFRIRVKDGTGTIQTLDFTNEGKAASDPTNPKYDGTMGGVNWTGWKYIECQFDQSEAGTQLVGPFTLMAGETIRIMAVPNTSNQNFQMGTWVCQADAQGNIPEPQYIGWANSKGCFYVDNLQLVYGANPADIDNPYIKTLKMGTSLDTAVEMAADGSTTVDSNTVMFYTEFADVLNENTTGVEIARVYVDGVNLTDKAVISIPDGKMTLDGVAMANGEHTVEVLVRDAYGNEATLTRSFQVQQKDSTLTSIVLAPEAEAAVLGNEYKVDVTSNNLADVKGVDLSLTVGEQVKDVTVEFADAYEGSYSFANGTLSLSAQLKDGAEPADKIATIAFNVRHDLAEHTTIQYKYSGSITYVAAQDGVLNTFAGTSKRIPVEATYVISVSKAVVDGDPCVITVTDKNGKAVKGADVYSGYGEGSQLVGTTKATGKLSTYMFSDAAKNVTPYAVKDGKYSFAANTMSYTAAYEDALPHAIQNNATVNGSTGKNISWLTNPLLTADKAVMLYATKAAYDAKGEAAFITAEGTVKETYFDGDKVTANANGVVITGLTPNTEYVYKVGDGENWSELRSFTTEKAGQDATNFFILADTQLGGYGESEYVRMDAANGSIASKNANYTFGIHVGDAVETANVFSDWDTYFKHFNTGVFDETDVIHVMGNHEDACTDVGQNIYNTNHKGYYSVDNGCVYVAVIDFNVQRDKLTEIMEWLKEDAAASNADWKFVATHVPVYYTNVTSKEILYKELLAPVCDEVGIDAVFSGHDHAFARTYPMVAGQIDETVENPDEGNGTVYYVCGTLGGKYYGGTNTPEFNFKTVQSGSRDGDGNQNLDPCAVFLTVNADKNKLTISAYDYYGSLIDQYTKTRKDTCDAGHEYTYNPDTGLLSCTVCGIEIKAEDSGFTGFANITGTEDQVYFKDGAIQTGFITAGADVYHACGKNSIAHKCDVVDTRTCTENGYKRYVCHECGEYQNGEALWAQGHDWDENHVCTVCGLQGIDIATVDIPAKPSSYTYTGKQIRPAVNSLTYEGRTLDIRSSRNGTDGYASMTNNVEVGVGTITVEGRGDFYGTVSFNFYIIPGRIDKAQANNVTADSATLTWTAAPGASKYVIEKYNATKDKWTKAGESDTNSFDVTGLTPGTDYKFRIAWMENLDGTNYYTSTKDRPVVEFATTTHSFGEWAVTTAPTCTEKGVETRTCATCGATETQAVKALGHDYKAVVTAPTCTEKGYTTHTCSVCEHSYVDNYVDATGHSFGKWTVEKTATCTEKGSEIRTCACGESETREIAALGHKTVVKDAKAATCTEQGYTGDKICTVCNTVVEQGKAIAALGHNFGEWTVAKAASCTEKGSETSTCATCKAVETREIAALGHNYQNGKCTRCGDINNPFVDIKNLKPEFKDAILWAYYNEPEQIAKGVSETEFAPNNDCTRAQVVTFLWRAAGCPEPTTENSPFTDVRPMQDNGKDNPYYKAILWAVEKGITNGFGDGLFKPNDTVTRAQFVTFLWRYEGQQATTGSIAGFADADEIAVPYQQAVAWAVENGITTGYEDGTFRPNVTCSRWAVVLFMFRDMA